MSLFSRIKQLQLKHFRRSYSQISVPLPRPPHYYSRHRTLNPTSQIISRRPLPFDVFSNTVRFFAAPVQAQRKEEAKIPQGLRLNEQIKAEFVRLVSDDGHCVVSRHEAMQRAKSLKLDLVEVDRQGKPPVCKIMDYNKERYKKQVKEKERIKSKSVGAIKKGDCKEVRFSPKTELKDLEMKADMAKRLMERGYRVKCMVMGTEDQDLGGLLSKLSALIEDVAFVETGPRVERKQAYVIVRHVKFGPSKKGGKKASNIDGNTSSKIHSAAATTIAGSQSSIKFGEQTYSEESEVDNDEEIDTPLPGRQETMQSVPEANHDFGKMFDLSHDVKGTTTSADKQLKFDTDMASSAANDASRFSPFVNPNVRSPSQESENRYARNVKKNIPTARNPMRSLNYEIQRQSGSGMTPGNSNSSTMKSHRSVGAGAGNSGKWGVFSKDSSNPMSGRTAQGEGKVP